MIVPNNIRGLGAAVCGYAPITRHPGGVHPSNRASPRLGGMDAVTPHQAPPMIPDHRFSIGDLAAQHAFPPAAVTPGNGAIPVGRGAGTLSAADMRRA